MSYMFAECSAVLSIKDLSGENSNNSKADINNSHTENNYNLF